MTSEEWRAIIEECMKDAGIYKPLFRIAINTLSQILEKRDAAEEMLRESDEKLVVEHVNRGGSVYIEQNPTVRLINDLNRDALSYMRELGITPKGLKAICDSLTNNQAGDPFLKKLEEYGIYS